MKDKYYFCSFPHVQEFASDRDLLQSELQSLTLPTTSPTLWLDRWKIGNV